MSSFARKLARKQVRALAKTGIDPKVLAKQVDTLPKALELLKEIIPQLNDAQTAIVQVLQELDAKDFELRRQRAVFLRMQMELTRTEPTVDRSHIHRYMVGDPTKILQLEEEIRGEYDAMFGLVAAFSSAESAAENGT